MNPALADKDEVAIEVMRVTLNAVDSLLGSLLEQVQTQARRYERRRDTMSLEEQTAAIGSLARLAVQRQLLEGLREGIPDALLLGDAHVLVRLI